MALENVLALLALFGRGRGGAPLPMSAAPAPGPMPSTGPDASSSSSSAPAYVAPTADAPAAVVPAAVVPTASPISTSLPTLPWPSGPVPSTLPPFPGPGWEPDLPVTSEIASRATYWNGMLWNFATRTQRKPFVQENLGGEWVTFAPAWHPGDKGPQTFMATEAWRVKHAAAAAPVVMPAAAAAPPMVVTRMPAPGPGVAPQPHIPLVGPYPGPGAWHTNAAYILRLQTALNGIGYPLVLDGKDGPKTQAAVKAFQAAHNLTQDGQAGATTQKAIDLILTGNYVSGSSVGWNLFHAIAHVADQAVHAFAHIAHDLGPVGTALAASMGLPPEAHLLIPVFMGAHAGNPAAQKHVEKVKAKGGAWSSFVEQMMGHLGAHPDFAAFLTHAQQGAHRGGGAGPHVVGWNLFHAIAHVADQAVHAFAHIAHDLGPVGIALAASMGLPPEAHLLIPALMAAHAGNHAAQTQVAAAQARGGAWPAYLSQMTQHLQAHPHFAAFHAHAQATAHHAAA